jgi:Lon protease-like protein
MSDSSDSPGDATKTARPRPVPLFPLPGLFLFPGTALPLHVFEPRYRQMVEDLLDRNGRLVLGTVMPGHESEVMGAPPVHTIAGLGEIARHERLSDGRFVIFVIGLTRVKLAEVASDRMYRQVEIEPLNERPVPPGESDALRRELHAAVKVRAPTVTLPKDIPLGQLTDLLLLHLKLDVSTMIDLYSRLDVTERARGALEQHAKLPVPPKPDPNTQSKSSEAGESQEPQDPVEPSDPEEPDEPDTPDDVEPSGS